MLNLTLLEISFIVKFLNMKIVSLCLLLVIPFLCTAQVGIIGTYAGNGYAVYAGDGGAATGASLNFDCDVAFDT
jgi:hypothetical protein